MAEATAKSRVLLPPFHPHQQTVYDDPHRFKVLVAGRRFGKSMLALFVCLDKAINEGKIVWFVSPTYNNVMVHWRNAKKMVGDLPTYKNEQQKYLEFAGGGSLSFKSGDRPDNLLGVGLDYVVVDEAAYQNAEVWQRVLRPALSDRRGGALLISTPNGVANWFYRAYLAGQDVNEPEWASWRYRSVDNPYMPPGEVDQAQRDMPELKFRQEYLAEFVSDAGGVFRNLEAVAVLDPLPAPILTDIYWAGVDWGRRNDFTVVSVFNQRGEQVYIERFKEIGWAVQRDRIKAIYQNWGIHKFVVEANSVGSAQVEALQAEGLPIEPVYMTNVTKTALVERFATNLERGQVKLLAPKHKIGEQQLGEMQSYSIQRTRGGLQITYNAPSGWHDDMVIAAILGASHIHSQTTHQIEIVENPFYRSVPERILTPEEADFKENLDAFVRAKHVANDLDIEAMEAWINAQVENYRIIADGEIHDERSLREKLAKSYIRNTTYA